MAENSTGLRSQFPRCHIGTGVTFILILSPWPCALFYLGRDMRETWIFLVPPGFLKNRRQMFSIATRATEAAWFSAAKGWGSLHSQSSIKNLLFHAYELQYLWHLLKWPCSCAGLCPHWVHSADGMQYGPFLPGQMWRPASHGPEENLHQTNIWSCGHLHPLPTS